MVVTVFVLTLVTFAAGVVLFTTLLLLFVVLVVGVLLLLLKKLLTGLTTALDELVAEDELEILELAILDEDTELTGQIFADAELVDDEVDETELEDLELDEIEELATVHELDKTELVATDDELAGVVKIIK